MKFTSAWWSRWVLHLSAAAVLCLTAPAGVFAEATQTPLPTKLHLPKGKTASFDVVLSDKGGFMWDIESAGTIDDGNNNALSDANEMRVGGDGFGHESAPGRMSPDGREVETSTRQISGLRVSRRIRVYEKHSLCRWLDILENPGPNPKTIRLRYRTRVPYSVRNVVTATGRKPFGVKDKWLITLNHTAGNRGHQVPQLLFILTDRQGKAAPTVNTGGDSVTTQWKVVVPAHSAVILCHFLSQGHSEADLRKIADNWKFADLVKDIPYSVRRLIVNFRVLDIDEEPLDLTRSAMADRIELDNGDVLMGRLTNQTFSLDSAFGTINAAANKVVGFATTGETGRTLLAMTDGQVISGRLTTRQVELELAMGSLLTIPVERIKQAAYAISQDRPDQKAPTSPLLLLRNGDRLAFNPADVHLTLQTLHGPAPLPNGSLKSILLDATNGGVHVAVFRCGAKLSGVLEAPEAAIPLVLKPGATVARHNIRRIVWPGETIESDTNVVLSLRNKDVLFGRLAEEKLTIQTDFGAATVETATLRGITFDPAHPGSVAVRLWDRSTLRGRLDNPSLRFAVAGDGPVVPVDAALALTATCPAAAPPKNLATRIETLIARLGSEVYADREKANAELLRLGATAAPLLKRYAEDPDPERRQRVQDLLDEIGDIDEADTASAVPVFGG